jgi:hypothetical protein
MKTFLKFVVMLCIITNLSCEEDNQQVAAGTFRWIELTGTSNFESQADEAYWTSSSCCTRIEALRAGVKIFEIQWTPGGNISVGNKPLGITGGAAVFVKNGSSNTFSGSADVAITESTNDVISGNVSIPFNGPSFTGNAVVTFTKLRKR